MLETPRTLETVTDALKIAEMLVQRMEDGIALSDRLEAWTDHRDELIAEHLELAYELATTDPSYASREKSWADVLDPFSTACLRDMLEHAERLVANPPSDWTSLQYGSARLWVERMLCQLAKREAEVTV